ncbi:MAG: gamma-glutamylcyclotransferase family protein [Granulosicoccus sp.]
MNLLWYFGYGSLVNRNTRPVDEFAIDARLSGWQRAWAHRVVNAHGGDVNCTSLTVEPVGGGAATSDSIEGVLVCIPEDALPALDCREAGYERLEVPVASLEFENDRQSQRIDAEYVIVYRSLPRNRHPANEKFPILHSYINCVMAGFHQRFGDTGLQAMLESTRGWESAIRDDREDPLYPRHVQLDAERSQYFETLLSRHRNRERL